MFRSKKEKKWIGMIVAIICYLVNFAGAVEFWDITVVDSTGDVGQHSSLAILPSGHPAISYCTNETYGDLKYAWYDGSTWQRTTINSPGTVGTCSLAILPSGDPAISYWDSSYGYVRYAWHDGSNWQTSIVGSGGHSSLAILPSGEPAIADGDYHVDSLKYAWHNAGGWNRTTVETTQLGLSVDPGGLAILPSGHPAIAYYEETDGDLKYAWYDGSTWHTQIVDSNGTVGWDASLAILPSGYPAISYYLDYDSAGGHYEDLKYAWYDGSTWHTTTVNDGWDDVGRYNSLAILPSGQPAISYSKLHAVDFYPYNEEPDDLKYAWHNGSTWQITTVDSSGYVGGYTSLAILPSGQPAISYYDVTNGALKYACVPNLAPAPLGMITNYTATAWTGLGGTTVVVNGPAYNSGWGSYGETAESSVSLEATDGGHLLGVVTLTGKDGEMCWEECMEWDPETGECLFWNYWCEPYSCGDANGRVTGTIDIGTSESYPPGSYLDITLQAIVHGDPGDAEDYHLKLWRGELLLGQISPSSPDSIVVPVFAGETLTFELFALEGDWYNDYGGYDRRFEFRMILGMPVADFNGDGAVNFRDYAMFALHWLDVSCGDPNWCGKTDLDKSGDVSWSDLKIFTDRWLEGI